MSKCISKVLIIVNSQKDVVGNILGEIRAYFRGKRVELLIRSFRDDTPASDLEDVDLAISLGGDGTLLACARMCVLPDIPILAVNLGKFGFITEISAAEWRQAYESYLAGHLGISHRIMVAAEVMRNGRRAGLFRGLNDAVVGTVGVSRLLELRLFLSGSYVGRYRADGVIIATPTGSTAYSMGAGGPILNPEMEAFVLNPICPFTLSNRPLVVRGDERIELEVERIERTEAVLMVDGQQVFQLEIGDRIVFGKLPRKSRIIRSDKRNFYEVLRSKLNWAGEPNA